METIPSLDELKKFTVKELREILRRENQTSSGNKSDLVIRCHTTFQRKDLRLQGDAETKDHYVKPQAREQALVNIVSNTKSNEETTYEKLSRECSHCQWSKDLRNLPTFNLVQLYDYLVTKTSKYNHTSIQTSAYKKLKAYQFFKEGHIKDIRVGCSTRVTYVEAEVLASMKQEKYKAIISFTHLGDVLKAACMCPAGRGVHGRGHCNHVGGVLFAMEDFSHRGLKESCEPVSCTSRLCSWNVPRNVRIQPKPVDDIVITKYSFGKEARKKAKNSLYDPRAPDDRQINTGRLETLCSNLAQSMQSSSFFLFHDIKPLQVDDENLIIDNVCESVPESAPDIEIEQDIELPFNDFYDISTMNFKSMIDIYTEKADDNEIETIERMTRGQSANASWRELKRIKLTASNFKSAAVRTSEPDKLLKRMMYIPDVRKPVPALEYGQLHESVAVEDYIAVKAREGNANLKVWEVGTIISKVRPGYGASLDRMVFDQNANGQKQGGLEVKCPFSKKGMSVEEACQDKNFCLSIRDGQVPKLKHGHQYYYQVQGQMFVCELQWIDFVVWFGPANLNIERVYFDRQWWFSFVLPRIEYFYRRAFLPEVFTRRVQHGIPLYKHGGWKSFKKTQKAKRSV